MWKDGFTGVTSLSSLGRLLIWPCMMGGGRERGAGGAQAAGDGAWRGSRGSSGVRIAGGTRPGTECASAGQGHPF